ncbi:MAG: cysteine synthase family protein [Gammaproteobacteria bacterium]|nr:cysteine synthase family protein [Gammaproteobacteria bacterium]MDH3429342.1 cysteine synthase family protein [Gammaproteobacteria bacterium]MDH3433863.1 cysteine synthase family protein [Gammaproteobacteria bacterium]
MSAQTLKKTAEVFAGTKIDAAGDIATLTQGRQPCNHTASDPGTRVFDSIVELAPSLENPTPMVRLSRRMNPHPDYDVFLKLEGMNPFGSIKDRTALYMLRGLQLRDDQALVEPSAGNTGIALAAMANAQNTPIEIAVPEGTPEEKKALLRLLGAELIEVEDELCPLFPTEGARGVVKSMVESEAYGGKYVSPNQYESELNVEAHYCTTGPEIWKQTNGEIEYFYAGIGTGGTISGAGRFLKEQNPDIRIIAVEPASRHHTLSGLKRITGLPDEHFPKILDRKLLDDLISVSDEQAYKAGIEVARTEGIMVGPTTGALLHAALHTKGHKRGKAVLISADNAAKYVSAYARYL